jgi:hypothetical protein
MHNLILLKMMWPATDFKSICLACVQFGFETLDVAYVCVRCILELTHSLPVRGGG